ncbi:SCO family protein [Thiomicrorhabdus immobilis]|uniref:SCO family protein n=1 Tax=Thiomicrorhabdus immobilis TaxID=2791037 RepID=A0ABN6CXJ4_9GAMM|nr:SCO family protein [Thiomicrorhabdus immobilis]BCN93681.1 SCO family protein [Thiomicrorhabdus immobilis]
MNSKIIIFILALGAVLATAWIAQPLNQNTNKETKIITSSKPQGGNFTLTGIDGNKQLSDYKGKLVLLYFGYTYCPDICPTNLGNLSIAYQQLTDEEKAGLQIIFVSVDPERDTPQRLQEYANYFDANIVGLTSSDETIAQVAKEYGVVYAKVDDPNNGSNYAVDHSAFTYVIDLDGKLQDQLPHATTPEMFIKTIRQYIH